MHTLDIPVCLAIQTRGRDLYSFLVSAVINHNDAMKSAYRVLYECKCLFLYNTYAGNDHWDIW